MSSRLPDRIDPVRLAERGVNLAGTLGLERMTRLSGLIVGSRGGVLVELHFGVGSQGRLGLTGSVSARVIQRCQRCLEPVELVLEKALDLTVVASDAEAGMLAEDAEPLVCGNDPLTLSELVEDELLLALPQEPKHTAGACASRHSWHSGGLSPNADAAGKDNPFAVLEQLKRRD